jgi:hypothetical protein
MVGRLDHPSLLTIGKLAISCWVVTTSLTSLPQCAAIDGDRIARIKQYAAKSDEEIPEEVKTYVENLG